MNFLSIASIPPLISSFLFLFIGSIVYKNNKKSSLSIPFFLLCFTTFIWQFVMFLLFNTEDLAIAGVLVKLAHVGIIFLPVAMYHFGLKLAGPIKKIDKYFLYINYVIALIFELLLFTNLFVDGFYVYYWSFYPKAGILHPFFLFLIGVTAIRVFYILLSVFYTEKKLPNFSVYQIKYILWAVIFYTFAASDFLLNYGIEFYPIGFLFILIFLSITSYAIVKHRLMDIKIVFRQSSVYFLSFVVIAVLAALSNLFNNPNSKYFVLGNVFIVFLLVIFFPHIKEYFFKLANKYFFTSLYNSQDVISDLSYKLHSTLELNYVYESICDSIDSAFHPEAFGFLIFESRKNVYTFKYKKGKFKNAPNVLKGSLKLHQRYIKKNKIIVFSEMEEDNDLSHDKTMDNFKKLDTEVLVPVNIKWKNIGLLILGKKETGDIYSVEDINLLEIISGLGASTIENGFLYEDISQKNKELEKLLEVKNDFLRITNHQLNTPLSIMRLAYSSVEEKSISIDEGFRIAKEGLNRLSDIISQLWMVFEMESGKIELKKERVDLLKMCDEMIEEKNKTYQVKNKRLKLKLNAAKNIKDLFVITDKKKIRDVFSGLLDNAIFYTKEGSVNVNIERENTKNSSFIKTSIIDTGVGISAEDQKNIFEKFYRGKEAILLHPDGSGIGLYLAKHIIEASGGVFIYKKTVNKKGSTFTFTLPIYKN